MKTKLVHSVAALLAGTGMALGQGPGTTKSNGTPTRGETSPGNPAYQMAGSPYSGAANTFTVLGDTPATAAPAASKSHAQPNVLGSMGSMGSMGGMSCSSPSGCGPVLSGAGHGSGEDLLYPGSQFWGGVEYLWWYKRDGGLPVIVGRANAGLANTNPLPAGAIDPLFGGAANNLDYRDQSGVRLTGGFWLDAGQQLGVDANYWQLERGSLGFTGRSNGDPLLGPVFFDPVTNRETLVLLASPNRSVGTVTASARDRMWGFETNVRMRTISIFSMSTHLLAGVRHLQFDEGIDTLSTGSILPTVPILGGTRVVAWDSIGVHNRFYAGQVGIVGDFRHCRWFANVSGKLAMGVMHERVNIQGGTAITSPTGVVTNYQGGVLAQRTNIGRNDSHKWAIMPEFTLNTGYQFTDNLRAFVGYNFFVLTNVARAGDQIDGVDARGVQFLSSFDAASNPSRPYQRFQTTSMWVQGLSLGMELRY